jgi:hypothetical protein
VRQQACASTHEFLIKLMAKPVPKLIASKINHLKILFIKSLVIQ